MLYVDFPAPKHFCCNLDATGDSVVHHRATPQQLYLACGVSFDSLVTWCLSLAGPRRGRDAAEVSQHDGRAPQDGGQRGRAGTLQGGHPQGVRAMGMPLAPHCPACEDFCVFVERLTPDTLWHREACWSPAVL